MNPETQIEERGIVLPRRPAALANYVGAVRTGSLLFLSGHIPLVEGQPIRAGRVGRELDIEQGYAQARLVGLNLLSTIREELRSLDRVRRIVKVLGFVRSTEGFADQPKVLNGFSDLMIEVFGAERGRHARSAVGVAELPMGAAVEVEMVVEIEP